MHAWLPASLGASEATISLSLRLGGGKGGFGSTLRAAGKKTQIDTCDSCGDLQGSRIRHNTAAQKLEEWQAEGGKGGKSGSPVFETSRMCRRRDAMTGCRKKQNWRACVLGVIKNVGRGAVNWRRQRKSLLNLTKALFKFFFQEMVTTCVTR